MCEECGKLKESSNNYFVPMGSFWAELNLQEAIKEGAVLVVPYKEDKEARKMMNEQDGD